MDMIVKGMHVVRKPSHLVLSGNETAGSLTGHMEVFHQPTNDILDLLIK